MTQDQTGEKNTPFKEQQVNNNIDVVFSKKCSLSKNMLEGKVLPWE
jgi:hypothetical protein